MSITRRLPRTVDDVRRAFNMAERKVHAIENNGGEDVAFSKITLEKVRLFNPKFKTEVGERIDALENQTSVTSEKVAVRNQLVMNMSHFVQVLNQTIDRGIFKATDRNFYGIDTNDNSVPTLYNEADIEKWAMQFVEGDEKRVRKGGVPMGFPSANELKEKYNAFVALDEKQSDTKSKYDKEQEDVMNLMDEARFIVRNIWDEVEFAYRYEDASSKRRKCREYGVVYVSTNGEELLEDE